MKEKIESVALYDLQHGNEPTKILSTITYLLQSDRFLSDPANYHLRSTLTALGIALIGLSNAHTNFYLRKLSILIVTP